MIKSDFNDYQLSSELLKAVGMLNFKSPTRIQQQVIPAILEQKNLIVKSQTGSGKTAAFAIPICELVEWDENKPQALVITPTRELAIQVKEDIFNIGRFKRLKVSAIYGKSPFDHQVKELRQKTHIVVGTPGRLIDHLQRASLDLSKIRYLVIDEADEMLNMGFIEQVESIIAHLPQEHVTILLSATIPKGIDALCKKYVRDPLHVEMEEDNSTPDRIWQGAYSINQDDKIQLLSDLTIIENPDSCIIFCNTQQTVNAVHLELKNLTYTCGKIHGGMEQADRLSVMSDFKKGCFRYLIATDVAARGIDIENVALVINYDIPKDSESYVHRIGRTGRMNNKGKSITFVTENEINHLVDISQFIGKEIEIKARPERETVNCFKKDFFEKINTTPELKETKGAQLSKEIMKLHINAGKKTKMRPVDIVGTLCNINGVTAEDIGIINIADISTFVEILNNKGELVFLALQDMPIKGRLRKVSKVGV
ncbi:MAG: DEAD/DEAH box helicase [Candidatus Fimivivens sp.]|nr:DEAD/DEAH box helicase [Candidatus Fimivivens sp.]